MLQSFHVSNIDVHSVMSKSYANRSVVSVNYLVLQFKFHNKLSRLFSHFITAL